MNIYKGYLTTLILIGIIGIGIDSVWDSLFLYQAPQCHAQFVKYLFQRDFPTFGKHALHPKGVSLTGVEGTLIRENLNIIWFSTHLIVPLQKEK